jgi:DNA-binding NarL/FixJ family response regulator
MRTVLSGGARGDAAGGLDHQRHLAQNQESSHQREDHTIRVLIVDRDAGFREKLRAALHHADDVTIVGEADRGDTAIERAGELTPDIVFLDIRMPDMDGIEATKAIKSASPGTRVILFMDDASRSSISEAALADASGLLPKDAEADELVNAARVALEGRAYLHRTLAAAFTEEARIARQANGSPPLSRREQAILEKLADGASGERIAKELGLSPNTVRHNIQQILEKLGVHSRMEAIIAHIRAARREPVEAAEPKTRTGWIHRLSEPHLRRILLELREDVLRQQGRTPSAKARANGRRFLSRIYDELGEGDLRDAVRDLTQEMSDEDFARLVEQTRE